VNKTAPLFVLIIAGGLSSCKKQTPIEAPIGMVCWQGQARILYAPDGKYLAHIGKPNNEEFNPRSCIEVNRRTAIALGFQMEPSLQECKTSPQPVFNKDGSYDPGNWWCLY